MEEQYLKTDKFFKTVFNQNTSYEYTFWSKYVLFFFFVFFAVILMPTFFLEPLELIYQDEGNPSNSLGLNLPIDNPEDVRLVRDLSKKMIPPARKGHVSNYDLPAPSKLIEELKALTDHKRNGYFLEVGSGDKDLFSDMLFLEVRLGWSGVLVEPDLVNMKLFRRNSWIAPACMSLNNSAYEFHHQRYIKYHGHDPREVTDSPPRVVCYPFHTFWLALNRPVIDYFSLDVGGDELEILETIPFDKVDIKIVHVDFSKVRDGFMGVTTFMQRNGFKVVSDVLPDMLFFIKKEYKEHFHEI